VEQGLSLSLQRRPEPAGAGSGCTAAAQQLRDGEVERRPLRPAAGRRHLDFEPRRKESRSEEEEQKSGCK